MNDFATQEEIEAGHPEEWVKWRKDIQKWICQVLNGIDDKCRSCSSPTAEYIRRELIKSTVDHPVPLAPDQR